MFSQEASRLQVELSAAPTSFFMTAHPLQGGLRARPFHLLVLAVQGHIGDLGPNLWFLVIRAVAKRRNPRSLTACANVKVTTEELQAIRLRARAEGLTVSEWGRLKLLSALDVDPIVRTMMAEFLGMRRIVLALYTELRRGGKDLSQAAIDNLVSDTEYRKYAMADRRIRETLNIPQEIDPKLAAEQKGTQQHP